MYSLSLIRLELREGGKEGEREGEREEGRERGRKGGREREREMKRLKTHQISVDKAVDLQVVHGGADLESHVENNLILLCQVLPTPDELEQTAWR